MDYFARLGSRIAALWSDCELESQSFAPIAYEVLSSDNPCEHVDVSSMVEWVATTSSLPYQPNLDSPFGQPPLTLFWHPMFYIEALFWADGTTAIHQHGFSGAFVVLDGSSLQSTYTFAVRRRVNENCLIGDLSLRDVDLLRAGDVHPIAAGAALIHAVFHLDYPTVTIVVRTVADIEHRPQYSYHRPGLAINPDYRDPVGTRRAQMLQLLANVKSPAYGTMAERTLQSSDLLTSYAVLRGVRTACGAGESYDRCVRIAAARHGHDITRITDVILEDERQAALVRLRRTITNADARFLIALLLNVDSRDALLGLVSQRYAGQDTRKKVVELICEMWKSLRKGEDGPAVVEAVRMLVDGAPVEQVAQRISMRNGDTSVVDPDILRQLSLFRPLIASGPLAVDHVVLIETATSSKDRVA